MNNATMKAIQVKYLPATDTKPTRLKAFVFGGENVVVSRDSLDCNSEESLELQAASLLARKLNWLRYDNCTECETVLRGGVLPNGNHCFVFVSVPFEARKHCSEFN